MGSEMVAALLLNDDSGRQRHQADVVHYLESVLLNRMNTNDALMQKLKNTFSVGWFACAHRTRICFYGI